MLERKKALEDRPMMTRRHFLTAAAAGLGVASAGIGHAQTYPTRPITMIVLLAPGSSADVIGRILAERMRESLGQPVIVENVRGASGSIGVGRLAHARPDGYTIDLGFLSAHVLNGALYSLPYDLLNDFEPISPLVINSACSFCKENDTGEERERIDRMAEGQSRQGVRCQRLR